jgi:GNAT superfamily N-acetyltransferase
MRAPLNGSIVGQTASYVCTSHVGQDRMPVTADPAEQVRQARESDCEAIVDLIVGFRREEQGVTADREPVSEAVRSCLDCSAAAVFVAERDAEIAGFVVVHWVPFPMLGGTEAYISDLIVRRDQRGRGVGRRLVAIVEGEARRRGCVRAMLNNRIAAESFRRAFYLKLGFRVRDDFANLVKTLR